MKNKTVTYTKKGIIQEWDGGIPLGNGCLGTLIYGKSPLVFYVDCNKIWDMRYDNSQIEAKYGELKEIVAAKDDDRFNDLWHNKTNRLLSYPTKLPGFRIKLKTEEAVETYSLDLSTAIATVKMQGGKTITSFISVKENLGYILCPKEYVPELEIPNFEKKLEKSNEQVHCLFDLGYKNGKIYREDDLCVFLQNTTTDYNYAGGFVIKEMGDARLIIYGVEDSFEGDAKQILKNRLIKALQDDYSQTLKAHKQCSRRYRNKSHIYIQDEENLSDLWTMTDYFFGCCSRNNGNPIALQGVWTADNGELPPWFGDYHFDLNVQMSYWSYMQANHLDCGRTFVDYLWKHKKKAELLAKQFFGGEGIALPGCADLNYCFIFGWMQYSVSLTAGCWACQAFAHYYEYTKSKSFLKTRAYPYFKGTADFVLSMCEEKNGYLQLPLSSSPEIFDNSWEAWLPNNSAYDISLVRYVLEKTIEYGNQLGYDCTKYSNALSKIPPIPVENGIISICEGIPLQQSHRHLSHMMGIYPLNIIKDNNEEEKKTAIRTIKSYLSLGTTLWVGYSFVWASRICTKLGLYDEAYDYLKMFQDGFVEDNGFHLNGDFKDKGYSNFKYRPFTLEANFAYNDALQAMLLRKNDDGEILLLEGINKDWKNLSFKLRCEDDIYECVLKNGELQSLVIQTKQEKTIKIQCPYLQEKSLRLKKGKNVVQ